MISAPEFTFSDAATFEENILGFSTELNRLDADCGSILAVALRALAS
jgi:hypothetical protein